MNSRNIILVTGRAVSGKTTYSNILHRMISNSILIADIHFLCDVVEEDDAIGGHYHAHPENDHQRLGITLLDHQGHSHSQEGLAEGPFPAIITHQKLVTNLYARFFNALAQENESNTIIAELGGGENGHPRSSLLGSMDFSYTTSAHSLNSNVFNRSALENIKLCLHIKISDAIREQRLQFRKDINRDIFMQLAFDDFDSDFAKLLHKHQIPIVTLNNDKDLSTGEIEDLLRNYL